jgi:1,4-alpha-glucan branching enzyme
VTAPGRLAIVLHSHMPYVEGFGTWPFGEEWLFEAMATSYLPLLDVLDAGAPVTLSLTPVLCDQLEAPGVGERFRAFLRDVRRATHSIDVEGCRENGRDALAAELERAAGDYERALERFEALGGNLLGALAPYAAWTSSATHAVLPLLATDAGVRLQVTAGIKSHRRRFDRPWRGGFWLPECAEAPWLDPLLEEAGVHATCVDLTDVLGHGAPEHLSPIGTEAGPLLVPVDRALMDLVWSESGYPSHDAYRDSHRRTTHDHKPWANGGAVYDAERAGGQAREHAADFVARARERVAGGGLTVCALDTELLGHWWYEGVQWLAAVIEECAAQDVELACLDDALDEVQPAAPVPAGRRGTTWGAPRDLSTWSGPKVADLAWRARDAELRVVSAGTGVPERAVRELLALQSSDWAFLESGDLAGPYAVERAAGHLAALDAALAGLGAGTGAAGALEPAVRNLAPYATPAPLLAP